MIDSDNRSHLMQGVQTMNKGWLCAGSLVACAMALTACGSEADSGEQTSATVSEGNPNGEQTISYLGEEYVLPEQIDRIVVTGAMEVMEDALVLDVEPVGAMTIGGAFPEMFAPITSNTEAIGEKTEPDLEKILSLDPDVILASTKFPPETVEELEKIAPTVKVSHIATDWEDNLRFLAELSDEEDAAEEAIRLYHDELESAKADIADNLEDKTILALRVRNDNLYIYPESIFLNPVLYEDFGIAAPEVTQAASAQELISTEQLAEINPDYLFIQDAAEENSGTETEMVERLKADPTLQNVPALSEEQTYVNIIDPLLEGGPSWSRMAFLDEAKTLFAD